MLNFLRARIERHRVASRRAVELDDEAIALDTRSDAEHTIADAHCEAPHGRAITTEATLSEHAELDELARNDYWQGAAMNSMGICVRAPNRNTRAGGFDRRRDALHP